MDLTALSHGVQKRKLKKRVGRGVGSGHGKTSSRGHKGQYASAGAGLPGALFTGGQTALHRRLPKRGFSNGMFQKEYAVINVSDLNKFADGATVDIEALKKERLLVGTFDALRILGDGELTKKVTVKAEHFSASAKAKIEAKGGTAELIPGPKKPVRSKMGQGKNSKKKKPDGPK
ncbi:50S ribosomal protein L15 [Limnoglobus roseus]|uniref:Large ribosomal subunit protein uL15 n=1 Tax=Limnoglobus roseus TaxID=2598579 RepID=A0A5C1AN27_9BACT|nr:50S ribosomal protein L15 [Limnoglobus roseus]QEL19975.1 50S ribosomal protein L15 [Limnoglobus roseus]